MIRLQWGALVHVWTAPWMQEGIVKLTDFATIFDNFLCEAALFSVANDAQTQPATKEYCGKSLQLWLT
jgi:hypothetical protein